MVPKNIGLDHSYCSHNKDFDEFKKDFDQQITKNGINQNHISDENSIKNAEIIFENNDSMPKFNINEDLTITEEVNFELLISRNFYKN